MTYEQRLLAAASKIPEHGDLVTFIRETTHEFWQSILKVKLDQDDFAARYLAAWNRHSVEGITIDALALAAIVETSGHLSLTHEQRAGLRRVIEKANALLIAAHGGTP